MSWYVISAHLLKHNSKARRNKRIRGLERVDLTLLNPLSFSPVEFVWIDRYQDYLIQARGERATDRREDLH